jgi:hypothetical protein
LNNSCMVEVDSGFAGVIFAVTVSAASVFDVLELFIGVDSGVLLEDDIPIKRFVHLLFGNGFYLFQLSLLLSSDGLGSSVHLLGKIPAHGDRLEMEFGSGSLSDGFSEVFAGSITVVFSLFDGTVPFGDEFDSILLSTGNFSQGSFTDLLGLSMVSLGLVEFSSSLLQDCSSLGLRFDGLIESDFVYSSDNFVKLVGVFSHFEHFFNGSLTSSADGGVSLDTACLSFDPFSVITLASQTFSETEFMNGLSALIFLHLSGKAEGCGFGAGNFSSCFMSLGLG